MNKQELIGKYEDKLKDVQLKFGANFKTKVYEELLDDLKQLYEPEPIKLRDVIARIKQLDIGTRKVWLDEFLNELGSDYGTLKYKAGYEQGKLEGEWVGQQLKDADKIQQELNKPVIPKFVADWLNKNDWREETLGEQSVFDVFDNLKNDSKNGCYENVKRWLDENGDLFARAWLDGYEVEKEKKYRVKMKDLETGFNFLNYCNGEDHWIFSSKDNTIDFRSLHTRKELEQAGLGEVFNSPLFEVEEVEV